MSISWVLGSNGLRPAGDGWIGLVSGIDKRQAGEVTTRTAITGNQRDRHHWRQGCPSSWLPEGSEPRKPGCSFPQRVNSWYREAPAYSSSGSCLALGCQLRWFRWAGRSPEILQLKAGYPLPYTGSSRGADTYEDQSQVVGSRLKCSSGELQPQKEGYLCERIAHRSVWMIWMQISMREILHFDPAPKGHARSREVKKRPRKESFLVGFVKCL